MADSNFVVVGQNNRNHLVQSKKLAPFHEDTTRKQPFEPASVAPGQYSKIKIDCKHAADREIILNDLRLRFQVDFTGRTDVGNVWAVRGTDLIRSLTVKFNEDTVFQVDKQFELTHLWLMNNHRLGGEKKNVRQSYLLNAGVIPAGISPPFVYQDGTKNWNTGSSSYVGDDVWPVKNVIRPGFEMHDGLPRLIYSDMPEAYQLAGGVLGFNDVPPYMFQFDMSLNQLCGPIFNRFHLRRVEYIQLEIMFEPWVSTRATQDFLLFQKDPVGSGLVHPYSKVRFTNLEIRQYRTTLLDTTNGFTLPPTKMLSWLMHRYSRREYTMDFTNPTNTLKIQLHDWEIRTNITRVYWMLAPTNLYDESANAFAPYAAPTEPYEQLTGVEIHWKNDKVLDLETFYDVYRHYVLSENKRHSLNDPYINFRRLLDHRDKGYRGSVLDAANNTITIDGDNITPLWDNQSRSEYQLGEEHYEVPIYHVDLNMNVLSGVPGAEIVGGIVNDTSDYTIVLKRVKRDDKQTTLDPYIHNTQSNRTVYVWIEYQTLVNLAAGSHQFNRASQVVTKQLNVQN